MPSDDLMFRIGEMAREIDALRARLADAERVVEAAGEVADRLADHPAFLGLAATDQEILDTGGDSGEITYLHHFLAATIKEYDHAKE